MESYSHGDPDVFNRPVAITDGIWDAASPDELAVIQMPSDFFRNNPNAQAKLANYTYLKATAVLRVVITSSPYTAGKALLGVVPQNGDWQMDKYRLSGCPCSQFPKAMASASAKPFTADRIRISLTLTTASRLCLMV